MTVRPPQKYALSGANLKAIAMVSMLIDHIAVVFLEHHPAEWLYTTMRMTGRLAFPLFAFLLAVGFYKTRHIGRYALRLGAFAFLSEIPFDYAFFGQINRGYQNVFFTLWIGLMMLALVHRTKAVWLQGLLFLFCGAVAHFIASDYGFLGIAIIGMMALVYKNPNGWLWPAVVLLLAQYTAPLAMLPIRRYDGSRGKQSKWLLYAFYPGHLGLFYLIGRWTG